MKISLNVMVFIQDINDGTYIIHLEEYESIGTHWIAMITMNLL